MKIKHLRIFTFPVFLFFSFTSFAQIFVNGYVPSGGNNDGTSWANAYLELSDALANASAGDEIWVSKGIYYPTSGTDRSQTFNLPHGVNIYGGFSGWENNVSQRNLVTNVTILSGDIGTINDQSDNSYNVVSILQTTTQLRLDGFVIKDGNAQGVYQKSGAGLFINAYADATGSGPIIANCIFQNNFSELLGGAVYVEAGAGGIAYPSFEDCVFKNNYSGSSGGAVYNNGYGGMANSTFLNCSFSDNLASGSGGAVFNHGGSGGNANPTFRQCDFDNNIATVNGGAVYNLGSQLNGNSSPFFINCRFFENKGFAAGAMYNNGSYGGNSSPDIINCTFYGNEVTGSTSGGNGGAIYCNGSESGTSAPIISNSIIWGNIAPNGSHVVRSINGSPTFQYTLVDAADCTALESGVKPGINCLGGMLFNVNPLFVDAANGDLNLSQNSPALDFGLNALNSESKDLGDNSRIFNLTIDLGAYERQASALPVELVFFNAVMQDRQVKLTWLTASEFQNDFFNVQHSTDGVNFQTIERVDGQGTSSDAHTYFTFHKNPSQGLNYYRLEQTDWDGTTALSDVKVVEVRGEELTIFPNPTSDDLNILFPNSTPKKYEIVINDILGKEILRTTVGEGSESFKISLNQLGINPGTYFIRVFDSNIILTTQKIQKK